MCGISGFLHHEGNRSSFRPDALKFMTNAISHRGPDSEGYWWDELQGIGIGHRRLSINDLSSAGNQPMVSESGRYIIAFNGEIYNHLALRSMLQRKCQKEILWKGHSDTETLLKACEVLGVEKALVHLTGMFAFAIWDRQLRCLNLVRDRFGEKPLYYGFAQGFNSSENEGFSSLTGCGPVLFGSELKALIANPLWQGKLSKCALREYFRFGCIGGANSIFQGVAKLPPGCHITISSTDILNGCIPPPTVWWSAEEAAYEGKNDIPLDNDETAIHELKRSLSHSVKQCMLSDVPLGAFLSGGIDSSLIVAIMQQHSERPVRTFSVGFDDARYDEAKHAERVAAHLGTEHLTLQATSQMALDLVPTLPEYYDEPFADASQIPSALLSSLVRDHVVVALSGDGGDELFGGYNRHLWVPQIWRKIRSMPLGARKLLATMIRSIPASRYDDLYKLGSGFLPDKFKMRTFGEKLYKFSAVLESPHERALFRDVASMNNKPDGLLLDQQNGMPDNFFPALAQFNNVEWMLLMDTLHFMTDDVLVKVDRASMASSLEVRVPFLSAEVFHTAWRIPSDVKIKPGKGKWVLRKLLNEYVPQELFDRPKMGFAVPLDRWLSGPLRDWSEGLLSTSSLADVPELNSNKVIAMWKDFLNGNSHYAQQIWIVLQFVAWHKRWAS